MLSCDVLIKNARILTPDMNILSGQTIAIKNSRILAINDGTTGSEGNTVYEADTIIDDPHLLWMPGLTDGHLHTSQPSSFR